MNNSGLAAIAALLGGGHQALQTYNTDQEEKRRAQDAADLQMRNQRQMEVARALLEHQSKDILSRQGTPEDIQNALSFQVGLSPEEHAARTAQAEAFRPTMEAAMQPMPGANDLPPGVLGPPAPDTIPWNQQNAPFRAAPGDPRAMLTDLGQSVAPQATQDISTMDWLKNARQKPPKERAPTGNAAKSAFDFAREIPGPHGVAGSLEGIENLDALERAKYYDDLSMQIRAAGRSANRNFSDEEIKTAMMAMQRPSHLVESQHAQIEAKKKQGGR